MTLSEVVDNLHTLNDEYTIYAKTPWSETSQAVVCPEPKDGKPPAGMDVTYFLEVFIAREFLEDWESSTGRGATLRERVGRLIQYAAVDV